VRRLLLSLAAGGLLCLAFPGYALWWVAPIAVAMLALATRGAGAWRGAGLAFAAGLAFFIPTLGWSGSYLGLLPWAALAICQACYFGGLGLLTGWVQRDGRVHPLVVALVWVAQEAARDRTPYGGFPWVRLAFGQSDGPFVRLAALTGAPGVTFAVALCGGLLAAGAHAAYRRVGWARAATPVLAGVAVALCGLLVPLPTDGPAARVLAVQGNVPRPGLDFNAERRAVLDNHVQATVEALERLRAAGRPDPDLVVWPENASDIDPIRNADASAEIQAVTDTAAAPIVVGGLLEEPPGHASNVSLLSLPGRGFVERYVKQHPVPFAEWIPDRAFFRNFSTQVDLVAADIVAGPGPVIFQVPSASGTPIAAGPSICFEVAYDDLVRTNVERGANLLLVQTNNATFGFTAESVQQLAISRLRAIEHGRSVVHVSTVGVSALIRPDGSLQASSGLFETAALDGEMPLRATRTLATVLASTPEYAALLALLALLAHRALSGRRAPGSDG